MSRLGKSMVEDQIERGRITINWSPALIDGETEYHTEAGWELTLQASTGLHSVYTWLAPGVTHLARVNEELALDRAVTGHVGNLMHLLEQGIEVTPYDLPGGWSGTPFVNITNTTDLDFPLYPDMRIAILTFSTVIGNHMEREAA